MKYWVGVVGLEHTTIAVQGGFCQFNHGKRAPVERMNPGDRFVIYSPRETIRSGESIQAFTAIAEVLPGEVYQFDFSDNFKPFRRDAKYFESSHAPIKPLLADLEFTMGRDRNWGQILRRGFFEIIGADFELIRSAMGAYMWHP